MSDDNKSPGFWQTAPGLLTAIAGIMTAGGGLLLVLYQIGVIGGNKSLPNNSSQSSVSAPATSGGLTTTPNNPSESAISSVAATPAPRSTGAASSVNTETERSADRNAVEVSISGDWYDSEGTFYRIQQTGNQFSGVAVLGQIRSEGSGMIKGREIVSQFSTNRPSSGRCTGTISPDSNSIVSSCWDNAIGSFPTTMHRVRN